MKINNLNVNLMLNFFEDLNLTFQREKCFQNALIFKSTSQSRFKQDKQIFIEILYLSLKKNIYYPFCFSFLSISSSSIKTLLIHSCESYSGIYIERSISVCHEIMKKRFRVAACLYINRTQMRPKQGKKISDALCCTCDQLLNRHWGTWNLFVNFISIKDQYQAYHNYSEFLQTLVTIMSV